ncbi:response regulator [Candidatus Omnitrophota bacterium]
MSQRILLVDDAPVTVAMAKRKLEEAGYIVHIATNGLEGLNEVDKHDFNLIITDVIMPLMDGVDFYKKLKKNNNTKNIPILIITDNQVFKDSFSFLGVDGFVEKPIDSSKLLRITQNILSAESLKQSKKAVIIGTNRIKVGQIVNQLENAGLNVLRTNNSSDLFSSCLSIEPDFMLIDILMDDVPPAETIRALNCFNRFNDLQILAYSCLDPYTAQDKNNKTANELQETINACLEAGASQYIGRFTHATLKETFNNLMHARH